MSFSYIARRAAQKERVRILYRRALKDTLNWAVHRHLFYQDASDLREKFEANRHVVFLIHNLPLSETYSDAIFTKFSEPAPKLSLVADWIRLGFRRQEDLDTIDRMIADAEATYNNFRHPDPYIVPWAPGGSKFTRNPTPPAGIEIIYNYGREDND